MQNSYSTLRAIFTDILKKSECSLLEQHWDIHLKKNKQANHNKPKAGSIQDNLQHYNSSLKETSESEDAEE